MQHDDLGERVTSGEFAGVVLTSVVSGVVGGGTIVRMLLGAVKNELRPEFATKDQWADGDRRIERNAGLFVQLDDRVGTLEEKAAVLEERQSQEFRRAAEQIAAAAEAVRDVTRELKEISKSQTALALQMEEMQRRHANREK